MAVALLLATPSLLVLLALTVRYFIRSIRLKRASKAFHNARAVYFDAHERGDIRAVGSSVGPLKAAKTRLLELELGR